MSAAPQFRLVPLRDLQAHEEVDPGKVAQLVEQIRRRGFVADPIWVAVESGVILNGHHRVAALRRLGAARVPAWLVDYHSSVVRLERWSEGPPIPKEEVEGRAARGELFPPKTTRHLLEVSLPQRRTPLDELLAAADGGRAPHRRASRSLGAGASDTT
jgi:L-serine kinase (ADP)